VLAACGEIEIDEVLERVAKHGDLFVEVLGVEQHLGLPSR
jgi:hypothetical protein